MINLNIQNSQTINIDHIVHLVRTYANTASLTDRRQESVKN